MAEERGKEERSENSPQIDSSKTKDRSEHPVVQTSDPEKNILCMLATYVRKRERGRKFVLPISFNKKLARDPIFR